MITLKKLSAETLAKATVLNRKQMSRLIGRAGCTVICRDDLYVLNPDEIAYFDNCDEKPDKICVHEWSTECIC